MWGRIPALRLTVTAAAVFITVTAMEEALFTEQAGADFGAVDGSGGSGHLAAAVKHGTLIAGSGNGRAKTTHPLYVTPNSQWGGGYGAQDGEAIIEWYAGNPVDSGLIAA